MNRPPLRDDHLIAAADVDRLPEYWRQVAASIDDPAVKAAYLQKAAEGEAAASPRLPYDPARAERLRDLDREVWHGGRPDLIEALRSEVQEITDTTPGRRPRPAAELRAEAEQLRRTAASLGDGGSPVLIRNYLDAARKLDVEAGVAEGAAQEKRIKDGAAADRRIHGKLASRR